MAYIDKGIAFCDHLGALPRTPAQTLSSYRLIGLSVQRSNTRAGRQGYINRFAALVLTGSIRVLSMHCENDEQKTATRSNTTTLHAANPPYGEQRHAQTLIGAFAQHARNDRNQTERAGRVGHSYLRHNQPR